MGWLWVYFYYNCWFYYYFYLYVFYLKLVFVMKLDVKILEGLLQEKWNCYKVICCFVSFNNKKKLDIIVVGIGLVGSFVVVFFVEMGYKVKFFCFQDSFCWVYFVVVQGGVNVFKNYQNDGDSVFWMFYDIFKGGDFWVCEVNVYCFVECFVNLIDQVVVQGVFFVCEYGGYLANCFFGGVQVWCMFYV